MNPVTALREIGFLLERIRSQTHRVKAYRNAADVVAAMTAEERDDHQRQRSWATVTGIGPKTALVITQAMAGDVPEYLRQLRDEKEPLAEGGDSNTYLVEQQDTYTAPTGSGRRPSGGTRACGRDLRDRWRTSPRASCSAMGRSPS